MKKQINADLDEVLRKLAMRAQVAIPEYEQDYKFIEKQFDHRIDYLNTLYEMMKLDNNTRHTPGDDGE